MVPHLKWARGGEATVQILDGDRITVLSTTPSAPGSRPEAALVASGAGLRIKVARCRRQEEASPPGETPGPPPPAFVIEGRLIDATRETRAEIHRLLDPAGGSPAP